MTELAQTYLGNVNETAILAERIDKARTAGCCLEVELSQTDCGKARIHAHSSCGTAVGIIKSRDWLLREGDVFETQQGLLLIHLQHQKVMVLSFNESVGVSAIELIHLGHVLGNHHWAILVRERKIYIQLTADMEVVESTIREFHIPGLQIDYESRSPNEHLTFSHHHHPH
ncbi:urease accessory protein UreE [Iningainema tapete]|uniref:Urease accessory protein UreE n=1 Tax=Iningainema tapete BLCC-T55 TaxID=2748662 RepID=A0A8J6XDC0_9CYAN|nr:urease accessory protein UreE [Iningainema tapete]MBD2773855.1 urease accessory protein UreE [Iningainema tapete BLCC-T55]